MFRPATSNGQYPFLCSSCGEKNLVQRDCPPAQCRLALWLELCRNGNLFRNRRSRTRLKSHLSHYWGFTWYGSQAMLLHSMLFYSKAYSCFCQFALQKLRRPQIKWVPKRDREKLRITLRESTSISCSLLRDQKHDYLSHHTKPKTSINVHAKIYLP